MTCCEHDDAGHTAYGCEAEGCECYRVPEALRTDRAPFPEKTHYLALLGDGRLKTADGGVCHYRDSRAALRYARQHSKAAVPEKPYTRYDGVECVTPARPAIIYVAVAVDARDMMPVDLTPEEQFTWHEEVSLRHATEAAKLRVKT